MLFSLLFGKQYRYSYMPQTDNAGIGFAPMADYPDAAEGESLVYLEILWSDFEPEEGQYDFSALEKKYDLVRWRQEGKHAVLRFLCDNPGTQAHRDIPDWLYQKTGDGVDYTISYGKGYAPDYTNSTLIAAHRCAIEALGAYFSRDNFVLYVELGSLGHWGEWHVYSAAGLPGIPAAQVCAQYVEPYVESFKTAKLLMRRPFGFVAQYGLGVFNDMVGAADDTDEWLGWLQNGGSYDQSPEPEPLAAQPDIWNTAPVGGEFTSSIPMENMLGGDLGGTLRQLAASHMSFLGPKCPHGQTGSDTQAVQAVKQKLGYQYWISQAKRQGDTLVLTWRNSGAAPFYWDWPVYLYEYGGDGAILHRTQVSLALSSVLPGKTLQTETQLSGDNDVVCVGIAVVDPMTDNPALHLSMNAEERSGVTMLY
jgi:hypothetical protein